MNYSHLPSHEQQLIAQSAADLAAEKQRQQLLSRQTVTLYASSMPTVRIGETIMSFIIYVFLMLLLTAPAWIDAILEMLK